MSKPVWVQVHWSENKAFKDNQLMPFVEFERKCRSVAREVGADNGYDKTKCKILFDDGEYYETRLDLSMTCDQSFEQSCKSTLAWIGSERFMKCYGQDPGIIAEYEELKKYINQIEWP